VLGNLLRAQGRYREAEVECRRAIELEPDYGEASSNLGAALIGQERYDEAETVCRTAIDLAPGIAEIWVNLSGALLGQGRYEEAEEACRTAVELKPSLSEAWSNLGLALMQQTRFPEAIKTLTKSRDLRPPGSPSRDQAERVIEQCERLEKLDATLPAMIEGSAKPASAGERIELAQLCVLKKLSAPAARFFAEAYAMAPRLDEDLAASRYNAACSAALAGCGRSRDGATLDEAERARWRAQARTWLRQELDRYSPAPSEPDQREVAHRNLVLWKTDPDLAGLRDPDVLDGLPKVERDECEVLWADVDAVLERLRPSR
jgi:tetratricopeptide (TPR) repeat protein